MASSPGRLGGVRAIPRLRDAAAELGMTPVPGFVTVPAAGNAFTDDGRLADPVGADGLRTLMKRLIGVSQQ